MSNRISEEQVTDLKRIKAIVDQLTDFQGEITKQINKYKSILNGEDYEKAVGRGTFAIFVCGSTPDESDYDPNGLTNSGFVDCDLGMVCAGVDLVFENFPEAFSHFAKVRGSDYLLKAFGK